MWRILAVTAGAGYTLESWRTNRRYLGLRAGGAVRKQRRGEVLSAEEQEALGHWQRLSLWRKTIAVGAFALGTFGLGLTVGGLIFGRRWRTARR